MSSSAQIWASFRKGTQTPANPPRTLQTTQRFTRPETARSTAEASTCPADTRQAQDVPNLGPGANTTASCSSSRLDISQLPQEPSRATNPYIPSISESSPFQVSESTTPTTPPIATRTSYPILSPEKGTPANAISSTAATQLDEYEELTEFLKGFPSMKFTCTAWGLSSYLVHQC